MDSRPRQTVDPILAVVGGGLQKENVSIHHHMFRSSAMRSNQTQKITS